jgi:hypothetical protein
MVYVAWRILTRYIRRKKAPHDSPDRAALFCDYSRQAQLDNRIPVHRWIWLPHLSANRHAQSGFL